MRTRVTRRWCSSSENGFVSPAAADTAGREQTTGTHTTPCLCLSVRLLLSLLPRPVHGCLLLSPLSRCLLPVSSACLLPLSLDCANLLPAACFSAAPAHSSRAQDGAKGGAGRAADVLAWRISSWSLVSTFIIGVARSAGSGPTSHLSSTLAWTPARAAQTGSAVSVKSIVHHLTVHFPISSSSSSFSCRRDGPPEPAARCGEGLRPLHRCGQCAALPPLVNRSIGKGRGYRHLRPIRRRPGPPVPGPPTLKLLRRLLALAGLCRARRCGEMDPPPKDDW